MKELKKIFIVELIASWILYILLMWLFNSIAGRSFDFLIILFGLIFALLFTGVNILTIYSLLKPKLNFLESGEKNVPGFGNAISKTFQIERSDFSFEVIKYKIKEQYNIVLYDDVEQYLLKFHSGIGLFSWGTAGCITYDSVSRVLTVTCFPLSAYTEKSSKATQAMMDKVESLIINK